MPNNFLQSSPSNGIGEWSDFNSSAQYQVSYAPQRTQPGSSSSTKKIYNAQLSVNLPSWTPIASKSIYNESMISYGTTPSNKVFNGLLSHLLSNDNDNIHGLNLTPIFNHNLSLSNSTLSNNAFFAATPYQDKTSHLANFFAESPIRQTPGKAIETITPSKFAINNDLHVNVPVSLSEKKPTVQKRSITQIDTPPRQPHKLSITYNHESSEGDEKEQENKLDEYNLESEEKQVTDETTHEKIYDPRLQTPSKNVLRDRSLKTNILKPSSSFKCELKTPARLPQNSSPSTVIVSSATKPSELKDDEHCGDMDDFKYKAPLSPTPSKEGAASHLDKENLIPVMGVFCEKKTKPKVRPCLKSKTSDAEYLSDIHVKPKGNKSHMQAGMNKFQIVFTDVHTLMNNKNRLKKNPPKSGSKSNKQPNSVLNIAHDTQKQFHHFNSKKGNGSGQTVIKYNNQISSHNHQVSGSSQEANDSTNISSKESSLLSGHGHNTTFNSSHLNISSSDHASFDMCGLSSTPNGKFILDRLFEKPSPKLQGVPNQQMPNAQPPASQMPPPKIPLFLTSSQQYLMMMSTPQHLNVLNCSFATNPDELSPSGKGQLSAFAYNSLQLYSNMGMLSGDGRSALECNVNQDTKAHSDHKFS